jgi:hypothetical protein
MPSLIGSAPNQVPTNGMLGTMAFQDSDNALVQNITSTGVSTLKDISVSGTATFSDVTTAVTQAAGDNSTKLATTAYVFAATPDSSQTVKGLIEIATSAEAQAGTDNLRAITPSGLRSGLNASGSAPIYACRAWVNFNGTGTVAIRSSGNVTSVTDNGLGNYTVNFTTGMQDSNYCVTGSCGGNNAAYSNLVLGVPQTGQYGSSGVQVVTTIGGNTNNSDAPFVSVAIFR